MEDWALVPARKGSTELKDFRAPPNRVKGDYGPEDIICMDFFKFISDEREAGRLRGVIFHPCNEISTNDNFSYAHKLKLLGKVNGIPDYVIMKDGQVWCIEVKSTVGVLSPAQKLVQRWFARDGVPYHVIRSTEEGIILLRQWGVLDPII